MPHLAARPRFRLAVEVQHQVGLGEQAGARKTSSPIRFSITQSEWRAVSPSGRPAIARMCCSNCEIGAGGFGPVAGIVDARRDLVGDQRAVGQHEELDADDADIVERLQDREGGGARLCGGLRRNRRRHGRGMQDAVAMDVFGRIVGLRARRPARAPRSPRFRARTGRTTSRMSGTPPIAAQTPAASGCRWHSGTRAGPCRHSPAAASSARRRRRARSSAAARSRIVVHSEITGCGYAGGVEEALFGEPVLRDLQRARRRIDRDRFGQPARRPRPARSRTRR